MCLSDGCLIIDLGDQYVGNYCNNVTQISSVVLHFGAVGRHTLLSWPWQILFYIYDNHVASQSFYMCQIYGWPLFRIFCFVHCGFFL